MEGETVKSLSKQEYIGVSTQRVIDEILTENLALREWYYELIYKEDEEDERNQTV